MVNLRLIFLLFAACIEIPLKAENARLNELIGDSLTDGGGTNGDHHQMNGGANGNLNF